MILALDLATLTGWALAEVVPGPGTIADRARLVSSGQVDLGRTLSAGERLRALDDWLETRFRDPLRLVAWERPHLRGGGSFLLAGFAAVATLACERHGCAYVDVHTGTVKKHATGSGRASKADVLTAMAARWKVQPRSDDEADALAVLSWALAEAWPQVSSAR